MGAQEGIRNAIGSAPIQTELIHRLSELRQTLRRRLVAYGVVAVAAGGVFSFLTIVTLDWMLRLPPILRIVIGIFFLAGFGLATLHWVVRPLRAPLRLREIAGTLERHFGRRDDRLSSAVDFVSHAGDAGRQGQRGEVPPPFRPSVPSGWSRSLIERVLGDTDDLVRQMRFADALSARPLIVRVAWLAGGLSLLCGIAWIAPEWPSTGLHRYLAPLGRLDWPHEVEVAPLTTDMRVAFGESVTVRMAVRKGWHPDLRGVVHLRDADGHLTSLTMQVEPESSAPSDEPQDDSAGRRLRLRTAPAAVEYACTIDSVSRDLTYWFEAGDDSSVDLPGTLRVARRPEVTSASIVVSPPPYAAETAPRELDAAAGEARAVIGSTLAISLHVSKPLDLGQTADTTASEFATGSPDARAGPKAGNGLRFADGTELPLQISPADPHRASVAFELVRDVAIRFHVTDRDGFSNRSRTEIRIIAQPDTPPVVTIVEPSGSAGLTEVTPTGVVNVAARVDDDFGVAEVELISRPADAPTLGTATDATTQPAAAVTIPLVITPTPGSGPQRVSVTTQHSWEIASLDAAPGDLFTWQVRAVDNHSYAGVGGQEGLSALMRIKIISEADFENRLRDDFALLQNRMRQALDEQETVKDDTDRIHAALADSTAAMSIEQQEQTASIASREARLAQRLRELARQFDRLRRQMDLNKADQRSDVAAQVRGLMAALQGVADGPLTRAVTALEQARASSEPDEQRRQLDQARSEEQVALDVLRELVHSAGAWGDFREVVNKARELFDRQQALREQTTQLGKRSVGQSVEELDAAQQAELNGQARRQRQLAEQTRRLVEQMQRLAESQRSQDPAAAESLDAAARAATATDVPERMRGAAEKIESNRTAAAVNEQRAAESGLAKLLAGLQERPARELAELSKKLERVEDAIGRVLADQRQLVEQNLEAQRAAAPAITFEEMVGPQRLLRRNTSGLADDLVENPRSADCARLVRRAVPPMDAAGEQLGQASGPAAAAQQQEAVTALEEALASVQELASKTKHEANQANLAALRAELEGLKNEQEDVNEQTAEIVERVQPDASKPAQALQRVDARKVSQLSRTQSTLREGAEAARKKIEEAVVYDWIMQRVVSGMSESQAALDQRRLTRQLLAQQDEIVAALQRLIEAIIQTESLPSADEFAEEGEGGGGGQAGAKTKPVPTVAELIVLRTLQEDLNTRTAQAGRDFDADQATEAQLRLLQKLGEEQQRLRELTDAVTQKARRPTE